MEMRNKIPLWLYLYVGGKQICWQGDISILIFMFALGIVYLLALSVFCCFRENKDKHFYNLRRQIHHVIIVRKYLWLKYAINTMLW